MTMPLLDCAFTMALLKLRASSGTLMLRNTSLARLGVPGSMAQGTAL